MDGTLYQNPFVGDSEALLIANLTEIEIMPGTATLQGGSALHKGGKISCKSDRELEGLVSTSGSYYIYMEDGTQHGFEVSIHQVGVPKNEAGTYTIATKR